MRRLGVIVVSVALIGSMASAASAGSREHHGSTTLPVSLALHESWVQWAFGGPTAPLLDQSLCGEMVGHIFYLTVAGGAPVSVIRHVDCDIPKGVPILATPGGAISWAPTYGTTDQQLKNDLLLTSINKILVKSVHVKLDGVEIDHGPLVLPDPYDLKLEPGNLIETVDPGVTGDSTRVAEGFYFTLFHGLDEGTYRIVTADKFMNDPTVRYRTVFTVNVS